jgi:hypothetical protein
VGKCKCYAFIDLLLKLFVENQVGLWNYRKRASYLVMGENKEKAGHGIGFNGKNICAMLLSSNVNVF